MYIVTEDNNKIQIAILNNQVIFLEKNKLQGEWLFDCINNTIYKPNSEKKYKIIQTYLNEPDLFSLLINILNSQSTNKLPHEKWTPIRYIVETLPEESIINISSHDICFHFDKNGNFKGISKRFVV